MQVRISVIIVSYNSESFIEKCIVSVLKNLPPDGEVLILDNASTDRTVVLLEKFLTKIKLIKSNENLGFSRGNNKAVREATGEYLFFLNPDTEINEPIFDEIIEFYEETPDAGIVGPKLIMENGEVQPTVRKLPTILGAFKEYILGTKFAYGQYVPKTENPLEVEMVYGAAMLIRKDLFEKLGGFEEKYFLYYEDADLCKRVRKNGQKIYYYPKIAIKHLVGATQTSQDKYRLNLASAALYHGFLGRLALTVIFQIYRLRRHL